ncbi:hypothetical protein B0H14DRAFT_2327333 [Mycena olivaceomarginata]|nr:hypothetical protein B0H14DRAFT_2327333 [Mycena olivaceomarginata]
MVRRQSCKAPSNNSASSIIAIAAPSSSSSASASSSAAATTATTKVKTTSTSTSTKSTSTGTSSSGGGDGPLSLAALFPAGTPDKSWTTSPKSSSPLQLSDNTLNPTRLISALSHSYMSAPDGKKAMQAHYPEGSYTFTHKPEGGVSFYTPGVDSLDMTTAKTLTFGYSVFFDEDFDFNMGGKLPGLYGGNNDDVAIGCSGGRRSPECYSVRLMWRTGGKGEIYSYLPTGFDVNTDDHVCDVAPESDCNPTYGASVGRGSFTFPKGQWTTVSQRVKLNDVGETNGEMQLFVNGESVIDVKNIVLRNSDAGRHRGIQMQTFFGGSTAEWASPKDQNSYFSDFSVAIIEKL